MPCPGALPTAQWPAAKHAGGRARGARRHRTSCPLQAGTPDALSPRQPCIRARRGVAARAWRRGGANAAVESPISVTEAPVVAGSQERGSEVRRFGSSLGAVERCVAADEAWLGWSLAAERAVGWTFGDRCRARARRLRPPPQAGGPCANRERPCCRGVGGRLVSLVVRGNGTSARDSELRGATPRPSLSWRQRSGLRTRHTMTGASSAGATSGPTAVRIGAAKMDSLFKGPTRDSLCATCNRRHRHGGGSAGAIQRGDAPVGALGLKMLHDVLSFINVRPAGDPDCSTDRFTKADRPLGNGPELE